MKAAFPASNAEWAGKKCKLTRDTKIHLLLDFWKVARQPAVSGNARAIRDLPTQPVYLHKQSKSYRLSV